MRFYNVEMAGKFTNQKVADASIEPWQASDQGRTIYDETTEEIYLADSTQWKSSGGIAAGTVMLFGQPSAPVGWTQVTSGFSDNAMCVLTTDTTGGGDDGGAVNAQDTHTHESGSHPLDVTEMPSHKHDAEAGSGGFVVLTDNFGSQQPTSGFTNRGASTKTDTTGGGLGHTHPAGTPNIAPYYFTIIAATKN